MSKLLKIMVLCVLFCALAPVARGQKIIEYASGMGSRDPENANVWLLFGGVRANHEGMVLHCDSATFDTKQNIFTAFRHVRMELTDTTTLLGDYAEYDGTTRIAIVAADTVVLIDGKTTLKSDILQYDRNLSVASYYAWGHTTHGSASLDSRKGYYHSDTRDLYLYDDVLLKDSNSRLVTDTLHYNTRTELAEFVSPTHIYSDTATVYSEQGSFHTGTHQARSFRASQVKNREKQLFCDTLYYNDKNEFGEAFGNVVIKDTVNDVTCYGHYGITDQQARISWVTDSALVQYVDKGDSLFVHADTMWVYNDEDQELVAIKACRHVRVYRDDVQGGCDSLYYDAQDSVATLYYNPIVWSDNYQLTADTIEARFDTSGIRLIVLSSNVFAIEKVDSLKFSQVKGRHADVYCRDNDPLYADILGSARMTYYVIDEARDGSKSIIGVNVGVGSDMRIYFEKREPSRVVTYGHPDMKMYPLGLLPEEEKQLPGFAWRSDIRPRSRHDLFVLPQRDDVSPEKADND